MTWLPHVLSAISSSLSGISGLQPPRDPWKTRTYFRPRGTQPAATLPHLLPEEGMNTGRHPVFQIQYLSPSFSVCCLFFYFPFFWGVGVLFRFNMFIFSLQCCLDDECLHVANSVDAKASDGAHRRPLIFSWQDGGRRYSSATVSARS